MKKLCKEINRDIISISDLRNTATSHICAGAGDAVHIQNLFKYAPFSEFKDIINKIRSLTAISILSKDDASNNMFSSDDLGNIIFNDSLNPVTHIEDSISFRRVLRRIEFKNKYGEDKEPPRYTDADRILEKKINDLYIGIR